MCRKPGKCSLAWKRCNKIKVFIYHLKFWTIVQKGRLKYYEHLKSMLIIQLWHRHFVSHKYNYKVQSHEILFSVLSNFYGLKYITFHLRWLSFIWKKWPLCYMFHELVHRYLTEVVYRRTGHSFSTIFQNILFVWSNVSLYL
jgi:hypothetical protein